MCFARRALFASLALVTACSLFGDTGDLALGPIVQPDAGPAEASTTPEAPRPSTPRPIAS